MQRLTAGALLLGALALFPRAAVAQHWVADTTVRVFGAGGQQLILRADTARGVWLSATGTIRDSSFTYCSAFDPDSAMRWLDLAEAIVRAPKPVRDTAALMLATPPLFAADRSQLLMVRRREGRRWSDRVELVLRDARGARPWVIRYGLKDAAVIVAAFYDRAARSRLRPTEPSTPLASDLGPASVPRLARVGQMDVPLTRQGVSDRVLLTFVVRKDGRADPDSFRALWFNDSVFVSAAVRMLATSRFDPGTINGAPRDVLVQQWIVFYGR